MSKYGRALLGATAVAAWATLTPVAPAAGQEFVDQTPLDSGFDAPRTSDSPLLAVPAAASGGAGLIAPGCLDEDYTSPRASGDCPAMIALDAGDIGGAPVLSICQLTEEYTARVETGLIVWLPFWPWPIRITQTKVTRRCLYLGCDVDMELSEAIEFAFH